MEASFRRNHSNDGQVMFEATTIAPTSSMDHFELRSENLHSSGLRGIRRRLVLKVEGLARFRNTLKRRPRVATVAFDRDGPLGHKRPASMLLFVF